MKNKRRYNHFEFALNYNLIYCLFFLSQVQARMRLESPKLYAFGDVYDCMGYMTAPIWSGILVTFIMILGASIGICAILDIKPPNRFDNNRSKQLTFTVQDQSDEIEL